MPTLKSGAPKYARYRNGARVSHSDSCVSSIRVLRQCESTVEMQSNVILLQPVK